MGTSIPIGGIVKGEAHEKGVKAQLRVRLIPLDQLALEDAN